MAFLATRAPVIFLVFNRPEQTARVFARIREARPAQLFVVADGPRADRPGEAERCLEVRRIVEQGIDWPCEVVRDYSATNLGCARRVSSGITNAFKQVEEAIILEDDCLPDPTFFRFCAELLERYRDDARLALVSGTNHQPVDAKFRHSYFYSRYNHIWGWATWRRAWQLFDFQMTDWPKWRDVGGLERVFADPAVVRYWRHAFDACHKRKGESWCYRWTFACFRENLVSILPCRSLVENIGFGGDATHTLECPAHLCGQIAGAADFPLAHPPEVEVDEFADRRCEHVMFHRPAMPGRMVRRLVRLARRAFGR